MKNENPFSLSSPGGVRANTDSKDGIIKETFSSKGREKIRKETQQTNKE